MSVRFCTLFSGSKANSALIEHISPDGTKKAILIDAGAGIRCMEHALQNVGSSLSEVGAIFVTHEHSDHIGGLKTILKKYDIPVVSNIETIAAVRSALPDFGDEFFIPLAPESRIRNGIFEVFPFDSSHDSAHCSGYIVTVDGVKLGYLTDCGAYTDNMINCLCGCSAVIIESNHDSYMLNNGIYPPMLKKRVASERPMRNGALPSCKKRCQIRHSCTSEQGKQYADACARHRLRNTFLFGFSCG